MSPSSDLSSPTNSADYSFVPFATQPFFIAENARLVDLVDLRPGQKVVDLACGPGAVTRLILEKVRGARGSAIIGVDLSAQALQQARQEFANVRDAIVQFIQARAEELSKAVRQRVDAVVFCNAIHLIEDKTCVLQEISGTLKPGGVFAFNTTFYQGSQPPETDTFYRRWMMRALRALRSEHHLEVDRSAKATARQQLSVAQYHDLLAQQGFQVAREHVQTVQFPLEGYLGISAFADFVEGALPGVPIETGSAILRKAAVQAFEELKLTSVPRNWLEVVAVRT